MSKAAMQDFRYHQNTHYQFVLSAVDTRAKTAAEVKSRALIVTNAQMEKKNTVSCTGGMSYPRAHYRWICMTSIMSHGSPATLEDELYPQH